MKVFTIPNWKFGLDTRKEDLTGQSGTLQVLQDCFVNSGGEIEKRKGFFLVESSNIIDSANLSNGFGLESTLAGLMTFGHAAPFGATPLNSEPVLVRAFSTLIYQQLRHPSLVNDATETFVAARHKLAEIPFSVSHDGKAFVAATFGDGRTFLYYDGTLVQQSANGIVMTGRTDLADLANDLLRQVEAINWTGSANVAGDAVAVTGVTRADQTATVTTATPHGFTTADVVEIVGAIQNEYNGLFSITVTDSTHFTYTVVGAPQSPATTIESFLAIKASVTQNGSVTIKAPSGNFISLLPEETSTAGYIGVKQIGVNSQATNGTQAKAAFQVDNCDGTFTLVAPDNGTAATPTIDLCGGAVASVGADSAANRILQAQKIVQAVNDLTYAHGYSALANDNAVFIFAPIEYGNFTFNLTVTPTTGSVSSTVLSPTALTVTLNPTNGNFFVVSNQPAVVIGAINSTVAGGTGPYTYQWAEFNVGSGAGITITNPTQASTSFSKSLTPASPTASGLFKLTVTDSLGATKVATLNVTLVLIPV